MKQKIMTNAIGNYIKLQLEVLDQLESLKELVENPDISPDGINWGHVGDLKHISKVLENLINPDNIYN